MVDQETSQVEGEQAVVPAGAEVSQPETTTETPTQSGVTQTETTTPVAPPQGAFTPEQQQTIDRIVSERTSKVQQETAQWKQHAYQLALERQQYEAGLQEQAAKEKDRIAVDNGTISDNDAQTRAQQRQEQAQYKQQAEQMKQTLAAAEQRGSQLGRIAAGRDAAEEVVQTLKQQGIAVSASTAEQLAEVFIKDKTITSPDAMKARAYQVAVKYLIERQRAMTAKAETFDKGPQKETSGGTSTYEQGLKTRYPTMFPK